MKIGIVGQGYVGLPLAMAFCDAGIQVVGFDLDVEKTYSLNNGISHVEDISNESLKKSIASGHYKATSDAKELATITVAIIAVPTPLDADRNPDLKYLMSASEILGKNLQSQTLIINESTSYPGTLRNLIAETVTKASSKGLNHYFAISPERVDPGNQNWSIRTTPRIYAGLTAESSKLTRNVYSLICDDLIEVSSPEVAEAAKLFENTFRQVNIALVNELALIMRAMDVSVNEVIEAASSKPYGFMKFLPSVGVGGHCIPVDPTYLAYVAKKSGVEPRFIELANSVNLQMPKKIIQRIKSENGGTLSGKKVLVCGISYKANISDTRESPSEILIENLRAEGAVVSWHDPLVKGWKGENSAALDRKAFDITVVAVLHDGMNINLISESSSYVFDCTGKLETGNRL
jgi:UDP-N-acetyl-D-glucosamine dehydrogenase